MLIPPFTLEQAIAICRDYQAIIGSIFEKESLGKGYIECVAVVPYEETKDGAKKAGKAVGNAAEKVGDKVKDAVDDDDKNR